MRRSAIKRAMAIMAMVLLLSFSSGFSAAASYPSWQLYVYCGGPYDSVMVSGANQYGNSVTWYGQNNGWSRTATYNWWWASYGGGYGYVNVATKAPGSSTWVNHPSVIFVAQPGSWTNAYC